MDQFDREILLDDFAPKQTDGTRQRVVFAYVMYVVAWIFTLMAVDIAVMAFTTLSFSELERRGGALSVLMFTSVIGASGWAGYAIYGYPAVRLIIDRGARMVTIRRIFGGTEQSAPFGEISFEVRDRNESRLGTLGLATGDIQCSACDNITMPWRKCSAIAACRRTHQSIAGTNKDCSGCGGPSHTSNRFLYLTRLNNVRAENERLGRRGACCSIASSTHNPEDGEETVAREEGVQVATSLGSKLQNLLFRNCRPDWPNLIPEWQLVPSIYALEHAWKGRESWCAVKRYFSNEYSQAKPRNRRSLPSTLTANMEGTFSPCTHLRAN